MPEPELRPVDAYEAGEILERNPTTIHVWAHRYSARQLGKLGRRVYYDFHDLAVIERELRHGHQVPPTPEERAAIRTACPIEQGRSAAA